MSVFPAKLPSLKDKLQKEWEEHQKALKGVKKPKGKPKGKKGRVKSKPKKK